MDDVTQKLWSEAGALREAARVLRGEFQPLVNRVPDWRNVERQLLEAADALEAAQRLPVSENVRDLVDDLRESAAQSYDELSQATIDVLNRAADYISRLPVSPEVTSVEQLDEAHIGTIIRDKNGQPWNKVADHYWHAALWKEGRSADSIAVHLFPARLLWPVPSQPVYDEEAIARVIQKADEQTLDYERRLPDYNDEPWEGYQVHAAALVAALSSGKLTKENEE